MADLLLSAMYRITDFPGESEPPAVTEPVEPLVGEDASVEDLLNSVVWPTQDTYAFNPNQARAPKGSSVGGQWIPTPSGLLEKVTSSTPLTGGYGQLMSQGVHALGDDPYGGLSSVVNPDRKKFGGMTNCVNVVVTAEMRLRGNDVKAKVDAGYSMSSDITRVFRTSLGFEPQFSRPANYKDARQAMALGKPGTRYIVGGFRQDYSSGHVWSAEVDEYGTLREFDWQSGDMDPGFLEGDHFWRVQYLRVDNLVLNEDAVMNGYDFSVAYPGRGRGVPMAVPYDQEQGDDDGTAYERDTLTASSEPVTLPPEVEVVEEILRPDGSVLLITEPALWDDCTYFKDPLTGQVVREFPADTILSSGFNPSQARIPKGQSGGGRWIDTPSGMLEKVSRFSHKLGWDRKPDEEKVYYEDLADYLETYYVFGAEGVAELEANENAVLLSRTYGRSEFSVEVDVRTPGTRAAVDVDGRILDRRGVLIGTFNRSFYWNSERDQLEVNHQHLELDEEHQGTGFGTEFSHESERMYAEMGVRRINVLAGLSDGGLAWARAGYVLDDDDHYINFDSDKRGEFQSIIDRYKNSPDDDLETIEFLDRMAYARTRGGVQYNTGDVDLAEAGVTIEDLLYFTDAKGYPVGEELLRGSLWSGYKDITPSPEALEQEVEALAASGATGSWFTSTQRSDALFEFCRTNRVEYTDDRWPLDVADEWRAIDRAGRSAWENSALLADGFAFNPQQARAPKGSSIGGRWILTPSGLLQDASTGKSPREALPLTFPSIEMEVTNNKWIAAIYNSPDDIKSIEDLKALADLTREALADAYRRPVNITVPTRVLNDIATDGRVHSIHHPDVVDTKYDLYVKNRSTYEHEVMGVPQDRDVADMPVYGWGRRKDSGATIGYGDTTIQLKKEVNQRTTYSVGDSMNQAVIPIWGEDIANAHMVDMVMRSQWAVEYYLTTDEGQSVMERSWREGPLGEHMWANYVEAQVHGGVTLDDIEGIYVGPNAFRDLSMEALNTYIEHDIEVIFESSPILPYQATARETILKRWPDAPPASLPAAAKWYGPDAIAASGFNPAQVRAPKGTPIGGRWIDTPSGLRMELAPTGPKRVWIAPTVDLESKVQKDLHAIKPEYAASLIATTRAALRTARNDGVHISMHGQALLNVLADGRMKNLQELEAEGGKAFTQAMKKIEPGAKESHLDHRRAVLNSMGIPESTPVEDLPIFGWGNRSGVDDTYLFGAYTVRLKPEVLERTSFTVGDSFLDEVPPIMAGDIETASDETLLQASMWNARNALSGLESGAEDLSWAVPYVEAQVHGGVSLSDIDAILINPDIPTTLRDTIITTARSAGLPVVEGWGPTRYTAHADSTTESTYDGWDLVAVTASGFNPDQARAPRGTSIGGRWITTPSGLLRYLRDGEAEEGLSGHTAGISLNRIDPRLEVYREAWESLPTDEDEMGNTAKDEVAFITQEYLREAIREGVHISVTEHTLKGVAEDGRFHTMRDRLNVNEVKHGGDEESMWEDPTSYTRGVGYVTAREMYEASVMGAPQNLSDDQRPIYGWATRESPWETSGYGDIDITLKESVNDRTTWTIGDSLNLQSRPLWTDEILSDETDRDSLLAASHWAIGPSYGPDGSMAARPGWEQGPEMFETSYVEAQVFGGITLDDIESVEISSRNDYPSLEETFATLEAHGVTIETWDNS